MFACLSSGLFTIAAVLVIVGFVIGNLFSYSPVKNVAGTLLLFVGMLLFTVSFFISGAYFLYGFICIILLTAFSVGHYKDFTKAWKQFKAGD